MSVNNPVYNTFLLTTFQNLPVVLWNPTMTFSGALFSQGTWMGAGTSTPRTGSLNRQNQHADKKMASATLQRSGFPFQPGYINRECWGGCSHSGTSSGCDFFVWLRKPRPSPWAANYLVVTFNSTQHAHCSEFGLLSPLQYSCAEAGILVLWKA